jgi:uracil-DNA glycosylase family 4
VPPSSALAVIQEVFPGATVEAKWTDLVPLQGVELLKSRGRVKRQIEQCRECPLYMNGSGPVPYSGPADNEYGVIGEAPGEQETRRKKHNQGPAGKLLRAMLMQAGLDPDMALTMTTIQCWPNEGRGKPRSPAAEELRACETNRASVLDLMQRPYVLLVGQSALKIYRQDLTLAGTVGMAFLWQEKYIVMPVYNPAGIKRDPSLKPKTQTALENFGKLVRGEIRWTDLMAYTCIRPDCNKYYDRVDEDAVPYCDDHFARFGPSKTAGVVSRKSRKGKVEWDELPLEGIAKL